jgi:two-component system, chemotaxis family, response regulator Rcp1
MNKTFNILLAEDNPADIKLTAKMFEALKASYRLDVVNDGVELVEYLLKMGSHSNAVTPDLILLDLNLPRKDGREVLREIKSHPKLKRIPVIVLSTSSAETDIVDCYDHHANCFIKKPIQLENFSETIKLIELFWIKTVTYPQKPSVSDTKGQ